MSSGYIQFVILNVLYDIFESKALTHWVNCLDLVQTNELMELNWLDATAVKVEISYLAEKKFLIGGSGTGSSPFDSVKLTGDGIEIIRFMLKNFPLFLKDKADEECLQFHNQLAAMDNEREKRLEIFGFIERHQNFFEDFLDKTHAISSTRIPFNSDKSRVGNIYYTGDIFQNIQNSTIVSKSNVENAFNKLSDKEKSKALLELAEFINQSGDRAAGDLFNHFTDELNKSSPNSSRLKKLWSGMVSVLPEVGSLSAAVTKIISLFN